MAFDHVESYESYSYLKLENSKRSSFCLPIAVMPLAGGQGGLYPTRNLGVQLSLLQPGGQIIPTTLLLAHPDLKTKWHLCIVPSYNGAKASRFSRLKNYVKKTRYIWTQLDFIDAK